MELLKKIVINDKKYISIAGIKLPYETVGDGERRKVLIARMSFTYYKDLSNDSLYIKFMNHKLYIRESRKLKHFKIRNELSKEKCKEILVNELTPLLGYRPDLDNPRTFNEKINWLKLNNHDSQITICCDKYAVKKYVSDIIGEEYVLPVIGTWEDSEQIDFDKLPERFVIKVNWSSGFNIIVKDKNSLDINMTKSKLKGWMQESANSYYDMFNWGYKNMKPIIYAEPYIEQIDGQVYDYKFFMSNGEFKFMFIATDRHNGEGLTHDFFDNNFEHLPFKYGKLKHAKALPQKPHNYNKMIELATKLSKPFPFVRVDFYEIGEKVFVGEMTFYPGGGTLKFTPLEWDEKLGEKINLNI